MKYTLILSALLVCGVTLAAPATPKTHAKAAPKKVTSPVVKAFRPIPGGFPDVPANHWAAQSVETLRRAGIVKGYPAHGK